MTDAGLLAIAAGAVIFLGFVFPFVVEEIERLLGLRK